MNSSCASSLACRRGRIYAGYYYWRRRASGLCSRCCCSSIELESVSNADHRNSARGRLRRPAISERASIPREVTREFQREHRCPSTGLTAGACPGGFGDFSDAIRAHARDGCSWMLPPAAGTASRRSTSLEANCNRPRNPCNSQSGPYLTCSTPQPRSPS